MGSLPAKMAPRLQSTVSRSLPRGLVGAAGTLLLLVCIPTRAATDSDPAPRTDMRAQVASEFHFSPPPGSAPETSPVLAAGVAAKPPVEAVDPGLVRMEAYTVHESIKMEALHGQFLEQKKEALVAREMKELGVGLHTQAVGPLHFYAATLFYVPFAAGVGISW